MEPPGYDIDIENWNHSPYNTKEIGSQNQITLAVAGAEVVILEGHDDTRTLWTASLTTFRGKERLLAGDLSHTELMFKASADGKLRLRLRESDVLRDLGVGFELWASGGSGAWVEPGDWVGVALR